MRQIALAMVLAVAVSTPRLAEARTVTFTATLKRFGGYSAYVALYLTDPHGRYVRTLWMAGGRPYYYHHMIGWMRASRGDVKGLDGVTGASVGEGRTLTVHADIAQSMIDAGYEVRVDAVSEGMMDSGEEVSVPLTTKDSGKPVRGRDYLADFSYRM